MEEWKDIKGFEGLYRISNFGRVYSVRAGKVMRPFDNGGYYRVHLCKNGKSVKKLVHVLVAQHFIGEKPFDGAQVNHKDLNKKNNHVENLEWVDGRENVQHCIKHMHGRLDRLKSDMSAIGKKYGHIGAEASKKPVAQIDPETEKIIGIYESARQAAKLTGANYKNISAVCTGKKKTHMGFVWRFADKEGATTIRKE